MGTHRKLLIQAIRLIALVAVVLVLLPVQAAAADVRTANNDITVGPNETVVNDLYIFGSNVYVQGTVDGSVIAAGGTVTISGHVARDVMVGGGTIDISGPVDGSVRVAGGTVNITGPVTNDVLVTGGTVTLSSSASVGRDLLLAGGTATVAAPVERSISLGAGTVTLENSVGGNVTGNVDRLTLTSAARIGGNLDYASNNTAAIDSGATVAGVVRRTVPTSTTPVFGSAAWSVVTLIGWLRGWIGFSALALLLILLFPAFSAKAADAMEHRPGASVGLGAGILVITPIVGLIAFIAGLIVGGWWLGLLLLPAYILACAVGYVVSALLLGRWTATRFGWNVHPAWLAIGGLFVLTLVGIVPVLGWLVSLAAVLFGLGALALAATTPPPSAQAVVRPAA